MYKVLEHEIKILRNSIADNTLDDQERCQNYEKRLEKLAQKGKKTYSGLTHLSTAMKALNKSSIMETASSMKKGQQTKISNSKHRRLYA